MNNPTTKEQFDQLSPEEKLQADAAIRQELHEAQLSKDEARIKEAEKRVAWLPVKVQTEIGNVTKTQNRLDIMEAIRNHITTKHRFPRVKVIAEELRISPQAVYNHLREIKAEGGMADELLLVHSQRSELMHIIMEAALNKDLRAIKLALDYIDGAEKENAPTIQINNVTVAAAVEIVLQFVDPAKHNQAKVALMQLVDTSKDQSANKQ